MKSYWTYVFGNEHWEETLASRDNWFYKTKKEAQKGMSSDKKEGSKVGPLIEIRIYK